MSDENKAIAALNALEIKELHDALERCCGALKWVRAVAAAQPYAGKAALFAVSESAFATLQKADWLEAFAHHPKIGDIESLRAKFASTRAWAGDEQSGTSVASEATLHALAQGNADYERKFGFIFIICATGKSAAEMLEALEARLPNSPEVELQNAAQQQKQITGLRLGKLLESLA